MSTAAAPPAAKAAPKATAPPLSLTTLKERHPNLYQAYSNISAREIDTDGFCSDLRPSAPIDPATGLATTIMMVDFTEPLEDVGSKAPYKTDSAVNKMAIFLWKMLSASESGSIGGDACRLYDALYAAYLDIADYSSPTTGRFELLMGWTMAVVSHGIGSLLERGDPDRNRLLFKSVADEFKKLFKLDDGHLRITPELRECAMNWCGHLQKMLKNVKKNYGEYSENYTFSYIVKPRAKKAAPAVASLGVDTTAAAAGSGKECPPSPSPTSVAMVPNITIFGLKAAEDDKEDDNEEKPWEEEGWVPRTKSGKQKTPNVIRGELQRYIDKCKAEKSKTQTMIIEEMGVNNNTFRRFMNPKTYKNQWSACQNGTYWGAAKLLEKVKHSEAKAKKTAKKAATSAKRKAASASTTEGGGSAKKKSKKEEATELIHRINAVEGVPEDSPIYDSCPVLVTKIKEFLQRDGVTKNLFLQEAMGNLNSNSLNRFLAGKKQDQCGTITYKRSYVFFEKLRIMEGKAKTKKRLKDEAENPQGFSTKKERAGYVLYFNPSLVGLSRGGGWGL